CRKIEIRELCQRCRAGSCNGNIRGGVDLFHAMIKSADKRRNTRVSIRLGNALFVLFSRQMDELNPLSIESGERFYDRFVDSVCSLASTHHEYSFQIA